MARRLTLGLLLILALGVGLPLGAQSAEQDARAINQQLRDHNELRQVRAGAQHNVVTLDGTVERYIDKQLAERVARESAPNAAVRDLVTVAGPRVADNELRERVSERLQYGGVDHGMTFRDVRVSASTGAVTLDGKVHSDIDRASALAIAGAVPGVRDVADHLAVDPSGEKDEDIRIRAARAIYGDPALQKYAADPQPPIRVAVDHGSLTLYGVVANSAEKRLAEVRAREVPGVFSVTNELVVAPEEPAH